MSNVSDLDLDLENLFQPAWAQGKSEANRFEKFTGNEGVKPERSFSDKPGERRAPRRDGPGGGGERRGGWRSAIAVAVQSLAAATARAVSVAATGAMIAARTSRAACAVAGIQRRVYCPRKTASNSSRARSR